MSHTPRYDAAPSPQGPSHRVRWGVAATIGLVGAVGVSAFMVIPGVSATPSDKVTICHATSATGNPYVVNTINTSSVDEVGKKYLNGHGDHTGPVFAPGMTSGWGDIIPPFTSPSGTSFPGYNWTSAGQAIWDAGCTSPSTSPSPTPTQTSPSPTPTSTSPTPTPTSTSPKPTPPSVRVTLCHATASQGNPYGVVTVDVSGVDSEGRPDLNGHGDHIGPVFTPEMTSGWGDIIPPFTYDDSSFPGYNWTSAGQAIWENQCAYTTPSPTPTPTETTGSPTPTPTETSGSPTPTETSGSPTPTPITTSPAPITTSPAPTFPPIFPTPTPTPTPTETSATPTPTTTSPAPITTSPAPITTSPAPTPTSTSSVSPTPIVTPSVDGTPTPPAPATTDNPNPSGGLPTAVAAGGGPGDAPQGRPAWLWLVAAAFLALLVASLRQLAPGRDVP